MDHPWQGGSPSHSVTAGAPRAGNVPGQGQAAGTLARAPHTKPQSPPERDRTLPLATHAQQGSHGKAKVRKHTSEIFLELSPKTYSFHLKHAVFLEVVGSRGINLYRNCILPTTYSLLYYSNTNHNTMIAHTN